MHIFLAEILAGFFGQLFFGRPTKCVHIAGFFKLWMPRPGFWYDQIIAWLVPFIALIGGFALIFAGARAYAPDNMLLRQFSLTDPVTGRRLEGAVTQPLTY